MSVLRYLLGLALALVVAAAGQQWIARFNQICDPVLIFVIFHSLWSRRGRDIVGGSVAGLAHDALTGGPYGQLGFVNTVVAFVCAQLRQRLVIQRPGRLVVFFALVALVQQAVLAVLRFLFLANAELVPVWSVVAKMATTGILGVGVFMLSTRFRRKAQRWREVRRRKLTLEAR